MHHDARALARDRTQADAIEVLRKSLSEEWPLPVIRCIGTTTLHLLEGRHEESSHEAERFLRSCRDPESFYYFGRQFAFMGRHERAVELLNEALRRGYVCFPAIARDPWFDSLRGSAEFSVVQRTAEARYNDAVQSFQVAGGNKLGLPSA